MKKMNSWGFAFISLIFIVSIGRTCTSEATSFSIDLVRRHTLQASVASFEHVASSLERSFKRLRMLDGSPQTSAADIIASGGEYLMEFSLGSPPVPMLAVADTGSDLMWIQCKPCADCFKQKAPVFNASGSSTYKPHSCSSSQCDDLPRSSCNRANDICGFEMSYGDRSFSEGDLASDTITFGPASNVSFPGLTIGCAHHAHGTFGGNETGIVGLGGGELSLIAQMDSLIGGKFSYCLVPLLTHPSKSSRMNLGENALVSGDGAVSTPLTRKTPETFYFLTLEGMTVGSQKLHVNGQLGKPSSPINGANEGNIIIDSGTTLTFLPSEIYDRLLLAVHREMRGETIHDPRGLLDLCYDLSKAHDAKAPEITVHFKGADLKLGSINTFIKTSNTSLCLAFARASSAPIFGNLAQMNFLIAYDLKKNTVSFKPTDCSQL